MGSAFSQSAAHANAIYASTNSTLHAWQRESHVRVLSKSGNAHQAQTKHYTHKSGVVVCSSASAPHENSTCTWPSIRRFHSLWPTTVRALTAPKPGQISPIAHQTGPIQIWTTNKKKEKEIRKVTSSCQRINLLGPDRQTRTALEDHVSPSSLCLTPRHAPSPHTW